MAIATLPPQIRSLAPTPTWRKNLKTDHKIVPLSTHCQYAGTAAFATAENKLLDVVLSSEDVFCYFFEDADRIGRRERCVCCMQFARLTLILFVVACVMDILRGQTWKKGPNSFLVEGRLFIIILIFIS